MIIIVISFAILVYVLPVASLVRHVSYIFSKNNIVISLNIANAYIFAVTADSSNTVVLKAKVVNSKGRPIANTYVKLKISKPIGKVYPSSGKTNKYGEAIFTYIPPEYCVKNKNPNSIHITASIYNSSSIKSIVKLKIVNIPIVYVHGYLANGLVFDNMKNFLASKGFYGQDITYCSSKGVIFGAKQLEDFLNLQKRIYLSQGIQVNKFNLIAHSMGGLVCRIYTTSKQYISNNDVKKIIFISVPQKGSHVASIGENYFDNQGIKDLIPDNAFFSTILPQSINKGLNSSIQVANILGKNDEVIAPENASLEEWNIKTEILDIGQNNINMNTLMNGEAMESPIHKTILSNSKIFARVYELLNRDIIYPSERK